MAIPIQHRPDVHISVERADGGELPFYCVSPTKLAVLSVATFGFYELFWFYRNWTLLKERSGRDISPFWRAFFSPFFYYAFATAVESSAKSIHVATRMAPGALAVFYALLFVGEWLPAPYWLVCYLTFIPLLPVVQQIRDVHDSKQPGHTSEVGRTKGAIAAVVLCGPLETFGVLGAFGPGTMVLRADEVPDSYRTTLVDAGVIEPDERMLFFYSAALLSVLGDGNLLTDRRVVSYSTWQGELSVSSAPYAEIADFETDYSESILEDTIVTVTTRSGDAFFLLLSSEQERDHEFTARLRALVREHWPDGLATGAAM